MRHRSLLLFLSAILIPLFASPALAVRIDQGAFSAELPKGWDMNQEGLVCSFHGPDLTAFDVTVVYYGNPNLDLLIKDTMVTVGVRVLENKPSYLIDYGDGRRGWAVLTSDGLHLEVTLDKPWNGIRAFLKSLKPGSDDSRDIQEAIKIAASPAVLDWLSYMTPAFAPKKKVEEYKSDDLPTEECKVLGLQVPLPEGWKLGHDKGALTVTSPDGQEFLIGRLLKPELKEDDPEAFDEYTTEILTEVGACNIIYNVGHCSFMTEDGRSGSLEQYGASAVLTMYSGHSQALSTMVSWLRPEGAEVATHSRSIIGPRAG